MPFINGHRYEVGEMVTYADICASVEGQMDEDEAATPGQRDEGGNLVTGTCCICGGTFANYGNNPWPVYGDPGESNPRCCTYCNEFVVLPARLAIIKAQKRADALR